MKKITSLLLAIIITASLFAAFSQISAISTTPEFDPNAGLLVVQSGASVLASHNVAKLAKDKGAETLAVVGTKDNTVSFKISATSLIDMAKAGMIIRVIMPNATMIFGEAVVRELSEKIKQEFELTADSGSGFKATFIGDNVPITLEKGVAVFGRADTSDCNSVSVADGPVAFSHIEGASWGIVVKGDIDAKFEMATAPAFTDVADNFWGKAAVDYVTSKGFFNGTGAGVFSPDAKMTRAMVVTVLSRIDGYSSDNITYTYKDTDKNAWFAKGVNWAFENKIADAGESFRPNDNITRIELMDMLYRFALKLGITEEITETNLTGFVDAARVTDEKLIKAASYCTGNGIVTGKAAGGKTALAPVMEATRAEVATMIQRFMRSAVLGAGTMDTNGEYKDFIKVRGNLNNLYNKLNSGERVVVSYFGGSVTDGHGASSPNNTSWRGLTFKWLKENFPKASLMQNNRAPGGTGSHYGAFRAQIDIIDPKSDLVFVEFVVNDYYCQTQSHGDTTLYYEQVIRQIREKLPDCDIISIFTTDSSLVKSFAPTELSNAAAAQDIVCEKYGVTSINVGGALSRELESLEGGISANWSKYVADSVHPADAGYKIYSEAIIEYLREYLLGAPTYMYGETTAYTVPDTYADARNETIKPELVQITGLDILDNYENIEVDPTSTSQNSAKRGSLYATAPDNKFSFTFTGTGIDITVSKGIYIFYSIDGGEMKKVLTFDQIPFRLVRGLVPGEHTITISIKGPTESGANLEPTHRISGFFVEAIK